MKKTRTLIAALAAMLMLSACGSTDASSSSEQASAASAADTNASSTEAAPAGDKTPTDDEAPADDEPAEPESKEFDESAIPVVISDSDGGTHRTLNLGMISRDHIQLWGFGYNHEERRPYYPYFDGSGGFRRDMVERTELRLERNEPDGFIFNGAAYAGVDYDVYKETKEIVANDDEAVIFVEFVDGASDEETAEVSAFAFDLDYAGQEEISFGLQEYSGMHFNKYFILGDSRETVESVIGPGYEFGGYVYYSTEEGVNNPMKTYTILEYNSENNLQRVFVLGRDRLNR